MYISKYQIHCFLFVSIPQSHNLSATHLLASPDGSRYLLDNANGRLGRAQDLNNTYRNIISLLTIDFIV